jgi:hypothetical protein
MKSGGQIDGQMSSQSPVVWWYREVNCEAVGMSVVFLSVVTMVSFQICKALFETPCRIWMLLNNQHYNIF